MVRSLENGDVDVAIALTEGLVAAKLKEKSNFKIIGTYVDSPLCWASVAKFDNDSISSLKDLKNKIFGISRYGSGSHIMSYILADNQGWDSKNEIKFKVGGGLEQLLTDIEQGESDTFMWEKYMLRPAVSSERVKYIGETVTPWPCFMIAMREDFLEKNRDNAKKLLQCIQKSTNDFMKDKKNALIRIQNYCSLNNEDSNHWFNSVKFSEDSSISRSSLEKTVTTLLKTGVLEKEDNIEALLDEEVSVVV